MVHVEPGQSNTGLFNVAGDLAERLSAVVIGIAAYQPIQIIAGDGYIPAEILEADRVEIKREIVVAEREFRDALQKRVKTLEWRAMAMYETLSDYIAHEARSADLIVTKVASSGLLDGWRSVDVGSLVMQAGRPIIVVPDAGDKLKLDHILVAWKDTRETRRAVCDALPLLKIAARVTIVEIAVAADMPAAQLHLEDVTSWLKRHDVETQCIASPSIGDDVSLLNATAGEQGADLIVAGAYGHSRLREFILGGVTHDLLLCPNRSSFVSH
jgi:nucleotide-binding universal stress UspA family protein